MKDRLSLLIGRLFLVGLLLSILLTAAGGIFYLVEHGHEVNNYQFFQKEPTRSSSTKIWHDAIQFTPYGIIQMGILILILTQLLRVALLACHYLKIHDFKFVGFSLFLLAVLIYSLFWQV
jgi:uncharacterized membrane protein